MCLHKISLSSQRCIHSRTALCQGWWPFCVELFQFIKAKMPRAVFWDWNKRVSCGSWKPWCYFSVVLFPPFSVPFVHLSYLCLLNRGKLVENCDNILSQPAAHQFDFNFNIRVFQVVHAFLLTSELAPQRYEWTQTLSRLLHGDLGSFSSSAAMAEAQKNTP